MTSTTKIDPANYLPPELSFKIFSYLDPRSLGIACRVSKGSKDSRGWKQIPDIDSLWSPFLKEIFNKLKLTDTSYDAIPAKQILNNLIITSTEEILNRLKQFSETIPTDEVKAFNCFYFFNPEYSLEVSVGPKRAFHNDVTARKNCIFMKRLPSCDLPFSETTIAFSDDRQFFTIASCRLPNDGLVKTVRMTHIKNTFFYNVKKHLFSKIKCTTTLREDDYHLYPRSNYRYYAAAAAAAGVALLGVGAFALYQYSKSE